MDDQIRLLEDIPKRKEVEENSNNDITPPDWNIEPPIEIERSEDEL